MDDPFGAKPYYSLYSYIYMLINFPILGFFPFMYMFVCCIVNFVITLCVSHEIDVTPSTLKSNGTVRKPAFSRNGMMKLPRQQST